MNQLFGNKYFCNSVFDLLLEYSDDDEVPEGSNGPFGINEWSPEARKASSKSK
jgi:hypothetical protein